MDHSRLRSLQNMTERYEGFGQSIKRVMEQKPNYPGIVGVVADIIRVNKSMRSQWKLHLAAAFKIS